MSMAWSALPAAATSSTGAGGCVADRVAVGIAVMEGSEIVAVALADGVAVRVAERVGVTVAVAVRVASCVCVTVGEVSVIVAERVCGGVVVGVGTGLAEYVYVTDRVAVSESDAVVVGGGVPDTVSDSERVVLTLIGVSDDTVAHLTPTAPPPHHAFLRDTHMPTMTSFVAWHAANAHVSAKRHVTLEKLPSTAAAAEHCTAPTASAEAQPHWPSRHTAVTMPDGQVTCSPSAPQRHALPVNAP
jgi:hypothetical protein